MKTLLHTAAIVTALLSAPAWAQTAAVKVEGAWARASVQGQKATGAFMRLTAKFFVRGGIFTNVVAETRKPGWQPAAKVELASFEQDSNTRD